MQQFWQCFGFICYISAWVLLSYCYTNEAKRDRPKMLSLRGRCLDVMTCMLVCRCWILITGWLGS